MTFEVSGSKLFKTTGFDFKNRLSSDFLQLIVRVLTSGELREKKMEFSFWVFIVPGDPTLLHAGQPYRVACRSEHQHKFHERIWWGRGAGRKGRKKGGTKKNRDPPNPPP